MHKRKVKHVSSALQPLTPLIELTPEELIQFDHSVCWAIEELDKLLCTKKSPKQAKDLELAVKRLQDPKVSVVVKKQIIRQHFGDYKKKVEESLEKSKEIGVCFSTPETPGTSHILKPVKSVNKLNLTEKPPTQFKFNFKSPPTDRSTCESEHESPCENGTSTFCIPLSDNSFRFNFELKNS